MSTRFVHVLGNFKLPKEIKSDIIYCQRALRNHIKVHQMIVDQCSKDKQPSAEKKAHLDEIENEIYEINCEQQYLLLRVRRIIDEFFKSVHRENTGVDRLLMNEYVSRELVPNIMNKDYITIPTSVRIRCNESQLMSAYVLKENAVSRTYHKSPSPPIEIPSPPQQAAAVEPTMQHLLNIKQESLLKPISERVVKIAAHPSRSTDAEIVVSDEEKPPLPVSSQVKLSRMNLRQALTKAAAAICVGHPQPAPVAPVPIPKPKKIAEHTVKKERPQQRVFKSEPSSSEESVEIRVPSPPTLDTKTMPDDYNQDGFLRIFNLFTQDQIQQLQQRRSKRKRRGVNTEKADFHYGRIEHLDPIPKKRKKEFLLSPRVNRALKKKRSSEADRSNSSSPEDKLTCNECLKHTGELVQCKECPGSYHEECHKDLSIKTMPDQCPTCSRTQSSVKVTQKDEKKPNVVELKGQFHELQHKLAQEKYRREKLQKESKMFKIGMRNLFSIVETIKSDDNDS